MRAVEERAVVARVEAGQLGAMGVEAWWWAQTLSGAAGAVFAGVKRRQAHRVGGRAASVALVRLRARAGQVAKRSAVVARLAA